MNDATCARYGIEIFNVVFVSSKHSHNSCPNISKTPKYQVELRSCIMLSSKRHTQKNKNQFICIKNHDVSQFSILQSFDCGLMLKYSIFIRFLREILTTPTVNKKQVKTKQNTENVMVPLHSARSLSHSRLR